MACPICTATMIATKAVQGGILGVIANKVKNKNDKNNNKLKESPKQKR